MNLKELYRIADEIAPFSLSEEMIARYGAYDNSGILLDAGEPVRQVLYSLDLSRAATEEAIRTGANCVFTHHPAIYAPLKKITSDSAIGMCFRKGISVVSAHLNLDAAPGGIDESLMSALGGRETLALMEPLSQGGYGRVFDVPYGDMETLKKRAEETLFARRISSYGDRPVKRIASFCGAGFDEEAIEFALEKGADTIVSSEGKHHLITSATERGLNLLLLTHSCSEEYGFYRFYLRMRERTQVPSAYYAERRFL